jgi:hypothetical protein
MRLLLINILIVFIGFSAAAEPSDTIYVTKKDTVYITKKDTVFVSKNYSDSIREAKLSSYKKRLERYNKVWMGLMPKGGKLQYAGNMGMFSLGPTWIYGHSRQWESSLLFGIIPRHAGGHSKITMTIKEDYIPWTIHLKHYGLDFQPLATGLYFNTVFSGHFWVKQPDRYPHGYYWFATRLRTNIYVGERLKINIPERRRFFADSMSLFYEISTCDYYLIQRISNSYLTPDKYLTLSFGIQFEWM